MSWFRKPRYPVLESLIEPVEGGSEIVLDDEEQEAASRAINDVFKDLIYTPETEPYRTYLAAEGLLTVAYKRLRFGLLQEAASCSLKSLGLYETPEGWLKLTEAFALNGDANRAIGFLKTTMKVARKHGNHKIDSKMPPDLLKELKEFGLKNRWETDLDKVRSIIDAIPRR